MSTSQIAGITGTDEPPHLTSHNGLAYRAPSPRARPSSGRRPHYFGYGLVLPFEIIYLHEIRGFSTSIAGLVLAATMGTSAIVTLPTGALLDRYSAKGVVVAGSAASALAYAGFAFVDRPWQGFACSIVGGAGLGAARGFGRDEA